MLIFESNGHIYRQSEIDPELSEYYRCGIYSHVTSFIHEKTFHLHKEIQHQGGILRITIVENGISISLLGLSSELMNKIEQAITASVINTTQTS